MSIFYDPTIEPACVPDTTPCLCIKSVTTDANTAGGFNAATGVLNVCPSCGGNITFKDCAGQTVTPTTGGTLIAKKFGFDGVLTWSFSEPNDASAIFAAVPTTITVVAPVNDPLMLGTWQIPVGTVLSSPNTISVPSGTIVPATNSTESGADSGGLSFWGAATSTSYQFATCADLAATAVPFSPSSASGDMAFGVGGVLGHSTDFQLNTPIAAGCAVPTVVIGRDAGNQLRRYDVTQIKNFVLQATGDEWGNTAGSATAYTLANSCPTVVRSGFASFHLDSGNNPTLSVNGLTLPIWNTRTGEAIRTREIWAGMGLHFTRGTIPAGFAGAGGAAWWVSAKRATRYGCMMNTAGFTMTHNVAYGSVPLSNLVADSEGWMNLASGNYVVGYNCSKTESRGAVIAVQPAENIQFLDLWLNKEYAPLTTGRPHQQGAYILATDTTGGYAQVSTSVTYDAGAGRGCNWAIVQKNSSGVSKSVVPTSDNLYVQYHVNERL